MRAFLDLLLYLLIRIHTIFLEPIHINAQSFMLANLQILFLIFRQQILHSLVVDLQHADLHLERTTSILVVVDFFEDGIADDGDESLIGAVSDHGVRLPRAGLPVREEAAVVALPEWVHSYHALVRMLEPISS
jgi:hypothetical protein